MASDEDLIFLAEVRSALDAGNRGFLDTKLVSHIQTVLRRGSDNSKATRQFIHDAISILTPLLGKTNVVCPSIIKAIRSLLDPTAKFYKSTKPQKPKPTLKKKKRNRRNRKKSSNAGGGSSSAAIPMTKLVTGEFAEQRATSGEFAVSPHLVTYTNEFGELKGFDNMLALLESKKTSIEYPYLQPLVRIAFGLRLVLKPQIGTKIAKAVQCATRGYVKRFSSINSNPEASIETLISQTGEVTGEFFGTREGVAEAGRLKRDLAARAIASERLGTCVYGVRLVGKMLKQKEVHQWVISDQVVLKLLKGPHANNEALLKALKPLVITLVKEEGNKEKEGKESKQPESKAPETKKPLGLPGVNMLRVLWTAWQERHESVQSAVFELIFDVVRFTGWRGLDEVHKLCLTMDPLRVGEFLVEKVKTFAFVAFEIIPNLPERRDPNPNAPLTHYGLEVLWKVYTEVRKSMEEGKIQRARLEKLKRRVEAAITSLSELLRDPKGRAFRMTYLHNAAKGITRGEGIHWSTRLILSILSTYPSPLKGAWGASKGGDGKAITGKRKTDTVDVVIKQLDNKFNLIDRLAHRVSQPPPSVDPQPTHVNAPSTASELEGWSGDIHDQLKVLQYLLTRSSLLLDAKQVRTLWGTCLRSRAPSCGSRAKCASKSQSMTLDGKTFRIGEEILKLFKVGLGVPPHSAGEKAIMSWKVAHEFLVHCLCKLNPKTFSKEAFYVFRRCFLTVGEWTKAITQIKSVTRFTVTTLAASHLIAIDTLWSIAMDGEAIDTYKPAATLLLAVYQQAIQSSQQPNDAPDPESSFLLRCVKKISAARDGASRSKEGENKSAGVSEEFRRAKRCIYLLRRAITVSTKLPKIHTHSYSSKAAKRWDKKKDVKVAVYLPPLKAMQKSIFMPTQSTVLELKNALGKLLKHPETCLRVHIGEGAGGQKMSPGEAKCALLPLPHVEEKTLHHLLKDSKATRLPVRVWKEPFPVRQLPLESWPGKISTKAYPFFKCLNILPLTDKNEEEFIASLNLARSAWKLLACLPPSPILTDVLATLKQDIKGLLPPGQTLQQLYVLQAMLEILETRDHETKQQSERRSHFISLFSSRKGFYYLLEMLADQAATPQWMTDMLGNNEVEDNIRWVIIKRTQCVGAILEVLSRHSSTALQVIAESKKETNNKLSPRTVVQALLSALVLATKGIRDAVLHMETGEIRLFKEEDFDKTDMVVEKALECLILILNNPSTDSTLILEVVEHPSLQRLPYAIFQARRERTRSVIKTQIERICKGKTQVEMAFSNVFRKELFGGLAQALVYRHQCSQYFDLISDLITKEYKSVDDNKQQITLALSLLNQVVKLTIGYQPSPSCDTLQSEAPLRGLMDLVPPLLHIASQGKESKDSALKIVGPLIDELYNAHLFPPLANPNEQTTKPSDAKSQISPNFAGTNVSIMPKSLHPATRSAIFRALFAAAIAGVRNTQRLLDLMVNEYQESRRPTEWRLDPAEGMRKLGRCGLVNLGCTCYLNALIQQIRGVPELAHSLLRAKKKQSEVKAPSENQKKNLNNSEQPKPSVLNVVQVILLHLLYSKQRFYNPKKQVEALLSRLGDVYGQPVDARTQMDVKEMAEYLFSWLETELKETDSPGILDSFFGGTTAEKLTRVDKPEDFRWKRTQFRLLTVPITGKHSLVECLRLFCRGETVTGVRWNSDGKQVTANAKKRSMLGKLPQVLGLHLARFEFDVTNLSRRKVNQRISFPLEIDLTPFTVEGIEGKKNHGKDTKARRDEKEPGPNSSGLISPSVDPSDDDNDDDDDQHIAQDRRKNTDDREGSQRNQAVYDLIGVVIHRGTATRGHYYSFVCEQSTRNDADASLSSSLPANAEWLEVNDTYVKRFSLGLLEEEAFGGEEKVELDNGAQTLTIEKERSAYLLLYKQRGRQMATGCVTKVASQLALSKVQDFNSEVVNVDELDPSLKAEATVILNDNARLEYMQRSLQQAHLAFVLAFLSSVSNVVTSSRHANDIYPLASVAERTTAWESLPGMYVRVALEVGLGNAIHSLKWCSENRKYKQEKTPNGLDICSIDWKILPWAFESWFDLLEKVIGGSDIGSCMLLCWLVDHDERNLNRIFVDCPISAVRSRAASLVEAAARRAAAREIHPALKSKPKRMKNEGKNPPVTPTGPQAIFIRGSSEKATISSPVTVLRGIGEKTKSKYENANIRTLQDLASINGVQRKRVKGLPDNLVNKHVDMAWQAVSHINKRDKPKLGKDHGNEVKQAVMKGNTIVGLTAVSIIPRFLEACVKTIETSQRKSGELKEVVELKKVVESLMKGPGSASLLTQVAMLGAYASSQQE